MEAELLKGIFRPGGVYAHTGVPVQGQGGVDGAAGVAAKLIIVIAESLRI